MSENLERSQTEGDTVATIREGNQAVLLVVDVQVAVMQGAWQAPRIIENIGIAVEKARELGVPVIWVQHSDNELVAGSPGWEIVPELSPTEDEVRIHKHFQSSFEQTPLEETLARLGAAHIVLAGAATNWCIRATAYGALDRGYDLTLLKDAHTTATIKAKDGFVVEAECLVRDLNSVMTWATYPGRANHAVAVADVDFAAQ